MKASLAVSVLTLAISSAFTWCCPAAGAEETAQTGQAIAGDDVTFLPPEPAAVPCEISGTFVPGGRNVEAHRYVVTAGYPRVPDRPAFVGMLSGTWSEMGRALGERAGDKVRCTSEIWWGKICEKKGKAKTLEAMHLYEQQIRCLDPHQIEFLQGIAAGAAPWLNQSTYADATHPFHAENYWRILAASIWDCWMWGDPDLPPAGCNSFAAMGAATADGRTIATQSQHSPHDGLCYLQSYVIAPPAGNTVWTVAATPNVCGLMVVNSRGVSISHHLGGATTEDSLKHPDGPFKAYACGVPWWNLVLYAAIHANTADEAIALLTVGPSQYHQNAKRSSVLRDGAWNWLVADTHTLAVVEATADRYAVRHPGEFTGEDWVDPNFIVCANHFLCPHSYDEQNARTDIPMTIFNGDIENSEERFWTLMWDVKERYGRIDKYAAQHTLESTYIRHRDTGQVIPVAASDRTDGTPDLYAHAKWGVQGRMLEHGRRCGTNTARVAVLDEGRSMVSWILGNPSDWAGDWDEYYFQPAHMRQAVDAYLRHAGIAGPADPAAFVERTVSFFERFGPAE